MKKERLVKMYGEIKGADGGATFVERVLDRLRIRVDVAEEDVRRIPSTGPVVVVSNHPFGALDGLILVHLLTSVRPDVKVLANALLSDIPEIKKMLIPVDPFEGPGRIRKNVKPVREAIRALRRGEMVCTFPAGIPILLKQYMKLGGRIIGFNRDPNFNNALDVLILVDLTITDPKILARYMGETSADAFLRYHRAGELEQCA